MEDMRDKGRAAHLTGTSPLLKLNPNAVREIRVLYASGEWTQRAIADRYEVSAPTVSHILSRRRWASVD